jgi:hypothetical protein
MRDTKPWAWIVLVIGLIIGVFAFMHMVDKRQLESGARFPDGATNIVAVGNDWYEFTYKDQRFLFYERGIADHVRSAIVKIDNPESPSQRLETD